MIKYFRTNILTTISIISVVLVIIPTAAYLINFGGHSISNDPAVWGAFGDYIGGIINTVLSLSSLIILGLLTNTISKQSNEENKKVNLLLKRIDSYEKLTDFLPPINLVFEDLNENFTNLIKNFDEPPEIVNPLIKDLERTTRFFSELYVFMRTFNNRYGHLYEYNFQSLEFLALQSDIMDVCEYNKAIVYQLKERIPGFPVYPKESIVRFNTGFSVVLQKLRLELK